jgi:hypothetical protein
MILDKGMHYFLFVGLRPTAGLTQPQMQWLWGSFLGNHRSVVRLPIPLKLVSRLRMPHTSQCISSRLSPGIILPHKFYYTTSRPTKTYVKAALIRVATYEQATKADRITIQERLHLSYVMKNSIFWDTTQRSPLKVGLSFVGWYRLHFQGWSTTQARNRSGNLKNVVFWDVTQCGSC